MQRNICLFRIKISALLQNPNIVRNKLKVNSAVLNANLFLNVQKEFGSFDKYIWQFTNGETIQNAFRDMSEIPANTPESDAMSKDLKKRGFKLLEPPSVMPLCRRWGW